MLVDRFGHIAGYWLMAGGLAEGMQQVAGNMKTALDKSIKDQPMATLAVAAIAGFVLGAIWKT
jgi:ElaB/YqjD/DUF883 family membrane-anchored ribosome-binding protein